MGKIVSSPGVEDVKVQVTRGGGPSPCGAELVGYLACLDVNNGDEQLCRPTREALATCMDVAMRSGLARRRHKPAINFHLKQVRAVPRSPELRSGMRATVAHPPERMLTTARSRIACAVFAKHEEVTGVGVVLLQPRLPS